MLDKKDKSNQPKFDEVDLQIIAARKDNPRATIREIADTTGIPKTTVWQRLCKIGESDWVKDARNECLTLLPAAIAVYALSLGKEGERVAAARDLLYGLGVLCKQHALQHSGPDGGPIRIAIRPEQFLDAFDNLTTAEQRSVIAAFDARIDALEACEAPTSGVVGGVESPSDASGPGA